MRKFGGSGLFKSRSPGTVVLVVLALGGMIGAAGWRRLHSRLADPPRSSTSTADTMTLPRVMLWAWERPEDLRSIDPHTTGVAFLAGTVEIRALNAGTAGSEAGVASVEATVVLHPRLQPLLVPPGTALMAVVRVETPNDLWHRPALSSDVPGEGLGEQPRAGGGDPCVAVPGHRQPSGRRDRATGPPSRARPKATPSARFDPLCRLNRQCFPSPIARTSFTRAEGTSSRTPGFPIPNGAN